jgi:hypothetical protein
VTAPSAISPGISPPREASLIASVPTGLLIGGEWREASDGGTFDVHDPATGEILATLASATSEDALAALDPADKAQASWARTAPREGRLHRLDARGQTAHGRRRTERAAHLLPTPANTASHPTSTAATSTGCCAWPNRSTSAWSASTPASSPTRRHPSAESSSPDWAAKSAPKASPSTPPPSTSASQTHMLNDPWMLGIDEHRYRSVRFFRDPATKAWKRYEPWMTTIVDLDTGQVLGIVDGRDSEGTGDWLFARPLQGSRGNSFVL